MQSYLFHKKSDTGQALVQFLMVLPLMFLVVMWIMRLSHDIDIQQKVQSLTWFGLREGSYSFVHRTMESKEIAEMMSQTFPENYNVHLDWGMAFNSDPKKRTDDTLSEPLASTMLPIFSILNLFDISMVRSSKITVTYPNIFLDFPYLYKKDTDNNSKYLSASSYGLLWTSWTNFAQKHNSDEYSYAGQNKKTAEEQFSKWGSSGGKGGVIKVDETDLKKVVSKMTSKLAAEKGVKDSLVGLFGVNHPEEKGLLEAYLQKQSSYTKAEAILNKMKRSDAPQERIGSEQKTFNKAKRERDTARKALDEKLPNAKTEIDSIENALNTFDKDSAALKEVKDILAETS